MARLTMERFMQLQEMGREPISLPEKIYFGGNETLQKTPGNHHLPQFRKTGTWNHPSLKAMRKRVAIDRAKRLINNKMPEVELRKIGGIQGLQLALAEFGLKLNEEQNTVAMMNATALEEEGKAKLQMREEQKRIEMAKLGIEYKPLEAEKTPFTAKQQVAATIKAQTTKLHPDDDLSGTKDESQKDKEAEASGISLDAGVDEAAGIVDTGDGITSDFVDTAANETEDGTITV